MSRWDDCYEYDPLSAGRWDYNSERVLKSKRGQLALGEIEQALLALPEPKLAYETFLRENDDGTVCACILGALARHKGVPVPPSEQWGDELSENIHEAANWAEQNLGIAFTLAWNLVFMNDELFPGHDGYVNSTLKVWTDEERYAAMLAYVREQIR